MSPSRRGFLGSALTALLAPFIVKWEALLAWFTPKPEIVVPTGWTIELPARRIVSPLFEFERIAFAPYEMPQFASWEVLRVEGGTLTEKRPLLASSALYAPKPAKSAIPRWWGVEKKPRRPIGCRRPPLRNHSIPT